MPDQSQVFTATNQSTKPHAKESNGKYTWKKILLAIVLAVIASGLIVFAVLITNPQIGVVLAVKIKLPDASVNPSLYQKPSERSVITSLKDSNKFPVIENDGIKLKVPWVERPQKKVENNVTIFQFVSKNTSLILIQADLLGDIRPNINSEDGDKIKLLFGDEILDSNYSFYKAILDTSPDDLHIFRARNEAMAESLLVLYKQILVIHLDKGIFSFQNDKIKGFQFGDPNIDIGVEIIFFDNNDNAYSLSIFGATQEEVDYILSSVEIVT